jgi:serine/threonine-protein kinase
VAIKRLHRELASDPELRDAFAAEARLAARIRHPNVVSVLDVVADGDELYLVMELASAVPLSKLVQRAKEAGQRLPPSVAIGIVCSVLRGLQAAHELGVVHRDVSPQNVLVGADGIARLVDFGIAKIESQATRGTALKGKPSYMAPEQLREGASDRRADVYAASVVLWELLTGARLFAGENDHAVMLKVLERSVDAPSRIAPGLPKELDAVVLRGLARDPDARFSTASSMAEALESSVSPATTSEIGRVVAELCADELADLESRTRAIETRPEATPRSRRTLTIFALGAVLVVGVGIALAFPREPTIASEARPSSEPSSVTRAAHPPPAPPSAAVLPAPEVSTPAKPPPPRVRATASPAAPSVSVAAPDCSPPYVIDAEGFRKMKPDCL